MDLENILTQGKAAQFYVRKVDIRTDVPLIGLQNNSNHTYTTPEKFLQNTGNGVKIVVHRNGQRQMLLGNYLVAESGGAGSGYDTIIFLKPPRSFENLSCDYIIDTQHSTGPIC